MPTPSSQTRSFFRHTADISHHRPAMWDVQLVQLGTTHSQRRYAHLGGNRLTADNHVSGLIGLAATAIALGQDVAPFLGVIIPPVLACFQDPESRVRYHACESLYNM